MKLVGGIRCFGVIFVLFWSKKRFLVEVKNQSHIYPNRFI